MKFSPDARGQKKYKDETLQTRSSHIFKLVLFKFVTRCVSHLMEFDRHFYSYEKKRKCVGIIKLGAFCCCCSINKIKGKGSGEMYKIGFLHNSNVVWVLKSIIFFSVKWIFFSRIFCWFVWLAVHSNNNSKYLHSNLITDEGRIIKTLILIDRKKLK